MKIKSIAYRVFRMFLLGAAIIIGLVSIIGTSGDEMDEPSTPQGLNTLPTAAISTPADNDTFSENDKVTFLRVRNRRGKWHIIRWSPGVAFEQGRPARHRYIHPGCFPVKRYPCDHADRDR